MLTTLQKPAGLPVFPPHADANGDCLLKRLIADQPWRGDIVWPDGFAGGIAHRLDNDTSGAVLVADNLKELTQLRGWFADHKLAKRYLLLAARDVTWDRNVCDKPIAHDKRKRHRMIVQRGSATAHRGKWYPAVTTFSRIRGRLFEAIIRTGVTHQIRVHAAFVGMPILGDPIYGGGRDVPLHLHHVGVEGPDGFRSGAVEAPVWVKAP
jgi:23S rRNA pseudouridine1911/1915/1917 synthase